MLTDLPRLGETSDRTEVDFRCAKFLIPFLLDSKCDPVRVEQWISIKMKALEDANEEWPQSVSLRVLTAFKVLPHERDDFVLVVHPGG